MTENPRIGGSIPSLLRQLYLLLAHCRRDAPGVDFTDFLDNEIARARHDLSLWCLNASWNLRFLAGEFNIWRLALCAVVIRGLLQRIHGLTFFLANEHWWR
jgi:hypothetical protein